MTPVLRLLNPGGLRKSWSHTDPQWKKEASHDESFDHERLRARLVDLDVQTKPELQSVVAVGNASLFPTVGYLTKALLGTSNHDSSRCQQRSRHQSP